MTDRQEEGYKERKQGGKKDRKEGKTDAERLTETQLFEFS